MSTKQIENMKVSKEQLEQDINNSWKEFLESGDGNIENPKNIFTRYIQEVFKWFKELKSNQQVSIGQDHVVFFDFKEKLIIQVRMEENDDIECKKTNLFSSPFSHLNSIDVNYDKNFNFIFFIHNNFLIFKEEKRIRHIRSDTCYYIDNSRKVDYSRYGKRAWIYDVKDMEKLELKDIFYKLICSNLIIDELKDNNAYKVLQGFKFEGDKFILSNLGNLENLKIDGSIVAEPLLSEDKIRADIKEYEPKMLTDVGLGGWELWEMDESKNDGIDVKLEHSLTARDPKSSIKDGVVGIDFGTKSTVVVYQEDTVKINPMRVGIGDLGKKIEKATMKILR